MSGHILNWWFRTVGVTLLVLMAPGAAFAMCSHIWVSSTAFGDVVEGDTYIEYDPYAYNGFIDCSTIDYWGGYTEYSVQTVVQAPNGVFQEGGYGTWWAYATVNVYVQDGGFGQYLTDGGADETLCDWSGCWYLSVYVAGTEYEWVPFPNVDISASNYQPDVNTGPVQVWATMDPSWASPEGLLWDGCSPSNPGICWVDTDTVGPRYVSAYMPNGGADALVIDVQQPPPPPPQPIPTGETTVFFNWQGVGGISQWWQNLLPSTVSFDGRTVNEFTGAGAVDNCYSQVPNSARPPLVALTGGEWPVEGSENLWGPDNISWAQEDIDYYRAQGVTPCSATIPQSMRINVGSGWVEYVNHNLIFTIGVTTITYQRGNAQPQSKPWP